MARPSKPMAKNNNSKFATRNNKQDIFSRITKTSKPKEIEEKKIPEINKPEIDQPNS